ncbi:hypothetical protein ACLKA7_002621 [Drosophila subpalustris]
MSEKLSKNSQLSVQSHNSSDYATSPNQLESLLEISSSSVHNDDSANLLQNQEKVKRIVLKTLEQLQSKFQLGDVETLTSLIVPKVLLDLQFYENLHEEVQTIKQSLNSYIQNSKVVSEDIAEIFLDLHNIYSKLEKINKQEQKMTNDKKFMKRISEANKFLKATKHYINNDECQLAGTSDSSATSASSSIPHDTSSSRTDGIISSSDAVKADKRTFLTNMIMVKKSDFSMGLNRNKQFYTEAERALKSNPKGAKESS